jgi:L-asparagine transporter-like permease
VIVIGSEVAAAGIYCNFWFPNFPSWIWIAAFSIGLVYLNTLSIKNFGTIEFWFAMIKVVTIVAFLIFGSALVLGIGFPKIGTGNFTGHGGFLPHGWKGVGLGVVLAIFSYLGLEIVGVTAGEAVDPRKAVPRALRRTLSFLALFYLGGLTLVVGIVPWQEIGTDKSPFVTVFEKVGIPAASHIMNGVVLSASLSSALCNLYFTARMLFSLSRGGYAPGFLWKLNKHGMPAAAVLASSIGMAAAILLNVKFSNSAFFYLIGVAFFGGPFIWLMTLATHVRFRSKMKLQRREFTRFAPPGPWSSLAGLAALLGVLASTWWIPDFHVTLLAGLPWLAFLTLCYFIRRTYQSRKSGAGMTKHE